MRIQAPKVAGLLIALALGLSTWDAAASVAGEDCPTSEIGKSCTDGSTCVAMKCVVTTTAGTNQRDRSSCMPLRNACPEGAAYMDRCGTNGRCLAFGAGFGGPGSDGGTISCDFSYYGCSEKPPGVSWDAGPGGGGEDGGTLQGNHGGKGERGNASPADAAATVDSSASLASKSSGCSCSLETRTLHDASASAAALLALCVARLRRRRARPFTPCALSVALVLSPVACSQKSRCVANGVRVEITGDHPHTATVSSKDVERGDAHTYEVLGEGHKHLFVLKAEDMQKLQRGEPVQTRSTSANAHGHEVTVTCKE